MRRWAHSANVLGVRHDLVEHLRGTARLARQFGAEFGAGDLSYAGGLMHDVGKLTEPWQQYLDASERGLRPARLDHKSAGAALLARAAKMPGWRVCQGHHGAIPNSGPHPDNLVFDAALAEAALELLPELHSLLSTTLLPARWIQWAKEDIPALEMGIRFVHSTLVDADFLDTAAHFNATAPTLREPADFEQLQLRFIDELRRLLAGRTPSPVDGLRAELLDDCLRASAGPRGVYRLPAPTGSGKTISAAAFALSHAAHHSLKRVIVAVPYLSITEQNAAVYRRLVGDEHVIEHHSGLTTQVDDDGTGSRRARYGVENWDAPFVVTTTVQLFESLFSNRPAKTRKLHRLANSVIILDEIQAIPNHVLPVILDGLRILQEHFGATVVLSSATQPTWDLRGPWRDSAALDVREIVADAPRLYAGLRRSTTEWAEFPSIDAVADAVAAQHQAMIIVNSTADARDLALLVRDRKPEGVLHLSTRMYPAHRRRVLMDVRRRLDAGLPIRLVTTQLVEAGVDLDFPVVFRALAPAQSLSQARGRCNREGRLASGRFVVLRCPELFVDLPEYPTGISVAKRHFDVPRADLDDPRLMRNYYQDLYHTLGVESLKTAKTIQDHRRKFCYDDVAQEFHMITDETEPVVIGNADEAAALLDELHALMVRRGAPPPERFRRLQDFTVNLRPDQVARAGSTILVEFPGVSVWRGPYDDLTGVRIDSTAPQDSVW